MKPLLHLQTNAVRLRVLLFVRDTQQDYTRHTILLLMPALCCFQARKCYGGRLVNDWMCKV